MGKPLRTAYPDNPVMAVAWASALSWAFRTPACVSAYEQDRGRRLDFLAPRSPIYRMIDKATGHEDAQIADFVEWFNAEVWGEDPFGGVDTAP